MPEREIDSFVSAHRILISDANHQRLEQAAQHLANFLGSSEALILAPTHGAADDFVRVCWRERGPFYGVHRLTPGQLAADLATADLARLGLAPITRLGMEALAARSIHLCRREAELAYFGPVADTPGFAQALARTLAELRMAGIPPAQLDTAGAPGKDLVRLLACYEEELKAQSLADLALILALATKVTRTEDHRLLNLPVFLLDITLTTARERAFVAALAQRSPAVLATALAQDGKNIAVMEEILACKASMVDSATASGARPPLQPISLERLRRYVFFTAPVPKGEADASVEFFSAPGEGPECIEIARRIRAWAEAGVAFDRMAILLRNPDAYLPLVEDALRRAGIPRYLTKGTIRPDPSGRAFLAILDCAADELSASKFAEYLSLGQVPIVNDSGAPPEPKGTWIAPEDELQFSFKFPPPDTAATSRGQAPASSTIHESRPRSSPQSTPASDESLQAEETPRGPEEEATDESPVMEGSLRAPFAWEKLLVDAAVIGGKERWSRRLAGLENEFRLQIDRLEDDDDSHRNYLTKQLERLKHLERFALPLIEYLDSLPKAAHWGQWLEALRKLAEMALRTPESVLSVLSELQPMDAVGPVDLQEVRRVLTERLSVLRREPPMRRYGMVFVADLREARARSFEIVFLPGLAEGVFPHKAREDPLLLDDYRKALDAGLMIQNDRDAEERLLLQVGAAAARVRLSVSYPRVDVGQGRSRVPSFYALEVLRATEGRVPALRELEKHAATPSQMKLGWWTPADWRLAIDDAEFDLAVLEQLRHKPAPEVRGRARYLITVAPHLTRSLRARSDRWSKAWSEADGVVNPDPPTLTVLQPQRLAQRTYSASSLQHFAACPYRFLLNAIHRLREREVALAIERLDPLTRGVLFHDVQFQFLSRLKNSGLLPVTPQHLGEILKAADEVLNRVAKEYEDELAPAIPQVWANEVEDMRTDLRGWVRQMSEFDTEWQPFHFEFAFGLPLGPERDRESRAEEAVILNGIRLRGSIDLIEKHRESEVLRVVDHKTGKTPQRAPVSVGGGEVLQPLLYAAAAENLLNRRVESALLYYCTQRGNFMRLTVAADDNGRARLELVLNTIDEAVQEGFLPAAPAEHACSYCDYRLICGPHEERRIKRKPTDRLDSLLKVRCLP